MRTHFARVWWRNSAQIRPGIEKQLRQLGSSENSLGWSREVKQTVYAPHSSSTLLLNLTVRSNDVSRRSLLSDSHHLSVSNSILFVAEIPGIMLQEDSAQVAVLRGVVLLPQVSMNEFSVGLNDFFILHNLSHKCINNLGVLVLKPHVHTDKVTKPFIRLRNNICCVALNNI